MTDLRQAAQQALEALEEYVNVVVSVNDPNEWTPKVADAGSPARKAITALKAALEQPEQPEQEPVAYYHPHKGFYWAKPTHIAAPTVVDVEPLPLYATPLAAQRPWVELEPEEILVRQQVD